MARRFCWVPLAAATWQRLLVLEETPGSVKVRLPGTYAGAAWVSRACVRWEKPEKPGREPDTPLPLRHRCLVDTCRGGA